MTGTTPIRWKHAVAWTAVVAAVTTPAVLAGPADPEQIVGTTGAAGMSWLAQVTYESATLIVAGRQGIVARRQFGPGEPLLYAPLDGEGRPLADGAYRWELRLVRSLPPEVAEALQAAEEAEDDRGYMAILDRVDGLVVRRSGRFRMLGGALATPGDVTAGAASSAGAAGSPEPLAPDTEISDADPRLTFTDTDENDFYLEANGDVLGFFDEDAPDVRIVALDAGSSADSIFVTASGGNGSVGLFTSTPASDVELHITADDGALPEILLEDPGASAQVWILQSGATDSLQVVDQGPTKDVQFQIPFEIEQGALDETLVVDSLSRVGIGTDSPASTLHVIGNATLEGDVALGSSRDLKTGLEPAPAAELLASLGELPLYTWSYRSDPEGARHLGPVAEDFHALFGLGRDDKHLSPADTAGLALAAIQGLAERLAEKDEEIAELRGRLAALESALEAAGRKGEGGALTGSGGSIKIERSPKSTRGLQ